MEILSGCSASNGACQQSDSLSNHHILVALLNVHLLAFLRAGFDHLRARVVLVLVFRENSEHIVVFDFVQVPEVEVFDIRDRVENGLGLHDVGILGQKPRVDDSPPEVARLELRVREADKHLFNAGLADVLEEVPHRICADGRDIVALVLLEAVRPDFLADERDELGPDLETEGQLLRKHARQLKEQPAEPAADIQEIDFARVRAIEHRVHLVLVGNRVSLRVREHLPVFLLLPAEELRVVDPPVDVVRVEGRRELGLVQGIDVRARAEFALSRHQPDLLALRGVSLDRLNFLGDVSFLRFLVLFLHSLLFGGHCGAARSI